MAVGPASDYAALLKEYQAKQAGVKKWEDIFLQPYQTAAEQVSTQTQYDISGAFAQYKKSQLSAMQNIQLGTGFKEQIASDLASQYGSAYSQLRQEEASVLGELQTSYLQTLAQQEEALTEQGERFAELENKMFDFAGITRKQAESAFGAQLGDEGTGLGYFETTGDGEYKITERGVDFFDELLNKGIVSEGVDEKGNPVYTSFRDYLLEQGEQELYDFYTQNYDIIKQLVGGLESGDVSYSKEERNIAKKDYAAAVDEKRKTIANIYGIGQIQNNKIQLFDTKYSLGDKVFFHRTKGFDMKDYKGLAVGDVITWGGLHYAITYKRGDVVHGKPLIDDAWRKKNKKQDSKTDMRPGNVEAGEIFF